MLKDSHDKRALFSCFLSPLPKPMDMDVRLKGYSNLSIDKNGSVNDCLALCLSWDTLQPLCDPDLYTNEYICGKVQSERGCSNRCFHFVKII